MLQSLNDWTAYLDEGSSADVVYLDFCKAFDRVPHDGLLHKLTIVGIHPRIVSWIRSFLSNRIFMVRIKSTFSEPRCVRSGVPQGGVLSPILFNIYTYELPSILSACHVKCVAFADDFKIYRKIVTADDHLILQNAINLVSEWSREWDLPLSAEKTKVLHLGAGNPRHSYHIATSAIQSVNQHRDLGFLVTRDLSFDEHCDQIAAKAAGVMHKVFKGLTIKNSAVLLQAFKTYVRPLLEYGTAVFNPYKRKNIDKIERVQNSFTRKLMIRSMGFLYDCIPSAKERNLNLGLRTLSWRRKKLDLLLFHKIIHGRSGLRLNMFCTERASTTRGGASKIVLPRARINCRSHFFLNRVVPTYTRLSRNKPISANLNAFKKAIDNLLDS